MRSCALFVFDVCIRLQAINEDAFGMAKALTRRCSSSSDFCGSFMRNNEKQPPLPVKMRKWLGNNRSVIALVRTIAECRQAEAQNRGTVPWVQFSMCPQV